MSQKSSGFQGSYTVIPLMKEHIWIFATFSEPQKAILKLNSLSHHSFNRTVNGKILFGKRHVAEKRLASLDYHNSHLSRSWSLSRSPFNFKISKKIINLDFRFSLVSRQFLIRLRHLLTSTSPHPTERFLIVRRLSPLTGMKPTYAQLSRL